MHISKKVVNIEGSLAGLGRSLLPQVETPVKLSLASILASLLTSLVAVLLCNTMFTMGSSSRGSDLIILTFCDVVGGAAFFL